MAISSMTGFGAAETKLPGAEINIEIRTVNHRFLDVNCKLPQLYSRYESELAKAVRSVLKRGRVDVSINRSEDTAEVGEPKFNEAVFTAYVDVTKKAMKIAGVKDSGALAAALPQILFRREVLELGGNERDAEAEWPAVETAFREALKNLVKMREKEGKTLETELLSQVDALGQIGRKVRTLSEKSPQSFSDKLKARLEKITDVAVDPQRLAQEVAILADKIDVTEELVRLDSHLSQFRQVISGGEGGRKLEFLLQEIGREVNTTGSKAQNAEITTLVVEAKAIVERLREQVLNIE